MSSNKITQNDSLQNHIVRLSSHCLTSQSNVVRHWAQEKNLCSRPSTGRYVADTHALVFWLHVNISIMVGSIRFISVCSMKLWVRSLRMAVSACSSNCFSSTICCHVSTMPMTASLRMVYHCWPCKLTHFSVILSRFTVCWGRQCRWDSSILLVAIWTKWPRGTFWARKSRKGRTDTLEECVCLKNTVLRMFYDLLID